MESEKVKEIKKALECCQGESLKSCEHCPYWNWCKEDDGLTFKSDILTLINELESENEKLEKNIKAIHFTYTTYNEKYIETLKQFNNENQQLKDRIAELEKENGELLKENEGCHGSYRCAIDKIGELSAERYIKVEQFAKMLKEELKGIVGANFIDQTLKEFIK